MSEKVKILASGTCDCLFLIGMKSPIDLLKKKKTTKNTGCPGPARDRAGGGRAGGRAWRGRVP